MFLNAIEVLKTDNNHGRMFYQNGTFIKADNYILTVSCKMYFDTFPFDEHNCTLIIQNFDGQASEIWFHETLVDYHPKGVGYPGNPQRLKFDLKMKPLTPTTVTTSGFTFSQARIHMEMTRITPMGLIATFYMPTSAFAMLAMVSYAIPIGQISHQQIGR